MGKQAASVSVTAAWKNKSSLLIWEMMKLMSLMRKQRMMRMKIETVPDCRGKQLLSLLFGEKESRKERESEDRKEQSSEWRFLSCLLLSLLRLFPSYSPQ